PSPLTTPAVTDPPNPSGFPTATTSWPTRRVDASPSVAGISVEPDARSTARSDSGSDPATSTGTSAPSGKDAEPRSVPAPTCAEVSGTPAGETATALPLPCALPPPRPRVHTRRLATDGIRRSTTVVTTRE